jgi:hypothetical protein
MNRHARLLRKTTSLFCSWCGMRSLGIFLNTFDLVEDAQQPRNFPVSRQRQRQPATVGRSRWVHFEIEQNADNPIDSVSLAPDLVIKVWRVYPYVVDCLQLMRTIFMPYQPIYFGLLKDRICVAFNDLQTFTFSVKFFNINTNGNSVAVVWIQMINPVICYSVSKTNMSTRPYWTTRSRLSGWVCVKSWKLSRRQASTEQSGSGIWTVNF